MNSLRVLIVEDQRALALALAAAVRQLGASSEIAPTAAIARQLLESDSAGFSTMILDVGLPDENGLDLLASLPAESRPATLVVTAHGEIENTITARKLGVSAFLTKPLDFSAFTEALQRILPEPESNITPDPRKQGTAPFIGASPAMRPVFQQIAHACATGDPVLISGETGTGKSLTASLIRHNSAPADQNFVAFQAGGAGDQASEFRAAIQQSAGGTLLIEGVENLDPDSQSELICHWESKDHRTFPRVLATSEPDLRDAVHSGRLRSELYYRLQVLEIRLPLLRNRIEDLPALFDFFLAEVAPDRTARADEQTLKILQNYPWPGNLRELRNAASFSATASGTATRIIHSDLPGYLDNEFEDSENDRSENLDIALKDWIAVIFNQAEGESSPTYRDISRDLERRLIRQLLIRHDGKLARLASEMKANRTTLRKKLRDS